MSDSSGDSFGSVDSDKFVVEENLKKLILPRLKVREVRAEEAREKKWEAVEKNLLQNNIYTVSQCVKVINTQYHLVYKKLFSDPLDPARCAVTILHQHYKENLLGFNLKSPITDNKIKLYFQFNQIMAQECNITFVPFMAANDREFWYQRMFNITAFVKPTIKRTGTNDALTKRTNVETQLRRVQMELDGRIDHLETEKEMEKNNWVIYDNPLSRSEFFNSKKYNEKLEDVKRKYKLLETNKRVVFVLPIRYVSAELKKKLIDDWKLPKEAFEVKKKKNENNLDHLTDRDDFNNSEINEIDKMIEDRDVKNQKKLLETKKKLQHQLSQLDDNLQNVSLSESLQNKTKKDTLRYFDRFLYYHLTEWKEEKPFRIFPITLQDVRNYIFRIRLDLRGANAPRDHWRTVNNLCVQIDMKLKPKLDTVLNDKGIFPLQKVMQNIDFSKEYLSPNTFKEWLKYQDFTDKKTLENLFIICTSIISSWRVENIFNILFEKMGFSIQCIESMIKLVTNEGKITEKNCHNVDWGFHFHLNDGKVQRTNEELIGVQCPVLKEWFKDEKAIHEDDEGLPLSNNVAIIVLAHLDNANFINAYKSIQKREIQFIIPKDSKENKKRSPFITFKIKDPVVVDQGIKFGSRIGAFFKEKSKIGGIKLSLYTSKAFTRVMKISVLVQKVYLIHLKWTIAQKNEIKRQSAHSEEEKNGDFSSFEKYIDEILLAYVKRTSITKVNRKEVERFFEKLNVCKEAKWQEFMVAREGDKEKYIKKCRDARFFKNRLWGGMKIMPNLIINIFIEIFVNWEDELVKNLKNYVTTTKDINSNDKTIILKNINDFKSIDLSEFELRYYLFRRSFCDHIERIKILKHHLTDSLENDEVYLADTKKRARLTTIVEVELRPYCNNLLLTSILFVEKKKRKPFIFHSLQIYQWLANNIFKSPPEFVTQKVYKFAEKQKIEDKEEFFQNLTTITSTSARKKFAQNQRKHFIRALNPMATELDPVTQRIMRPKQTKMRENEDKMKDEGEESDENESKDKMKDEGEDSDESSDEDVSKKRKRKRKHSSDSEEEYISLKEKKEIKRFKWKTYLKNVNSINRQDSSSSSGSSSSGRTSSSSGRSSISSNEDKSSKKNIPTYFTWDGDKDDEVINNENHMEECYNCRIKATLIKRCDNCNKKYCSDCWRNQSNKCSTCRNW